MAFEAGVTVMTMIQLLLTASVGLPMWFVLSLGDPRRTQNSRTAWLLAGWGWVTVAWETLILLATFRVAVPLWLAALVLLAQDGVFGWWLVQLYRTRRKDKGSSTMDKDTLWWRLVHLEPALLRGAVVAVVALLSAVGILVAPGIPDALLGAWGAAAAIVAAVWTRPAVTANARVVVEAPNPISEPEKVVAGEAITTASRTDIIDAAREDPRG